MRSARRAIVLSLAAVAAFMVTPAGAADCGDTAGPGGTRVACACGDRMVTDTTLRATDPVAAGACITSGLDIGANDLVLDCRGLTLRGSSSSGVFARTGNTVRSCVIRGFAVGIGMTGDGGATIVLNKLTDNDTGVLIFGGTGYLIERNQIEGNSNDGLLDLGSGANTIRQNRVSGNGGAGLDLQTGGNVISRNITDSNGKEGIAVSGNGNLLDGNRGKGNGTDTQSGTWSGMLVTGSGNTLTRNVYDDNAGHGICAVPSSIDGGGNRGHGNGFLPDVEFLCT